MHHAVVAMVREKTVQRGPIHGARAQKLVKVGHRVGDRSPGDHVEGRPKWGGDLNLVPRTVMGSVDPYPPYVQPGSAVHARTVQGQNLDGIVRAGQRNTADGCC